MSSSPSKSSSSSFEVSAFCFLFFILRICSSQKPEQMSHGDSRVTQGSSPLFASLQEGQKLWLSNGRQKCLHFKDLGLSLLILWVLGGHFYCNENAVSLKRENSQNTKKLINTYLFQTELSQNILYPEISIQFHMLRYCSAIKVLPVTRLLLQKEDYNKSLLAEINT